MKFDALMGLRQDYLQRIQQLQLRKLEEEEQNNAAQVIQSYQHEIEQIDEAFQTVEPSMDRSANRSFGTVDDNYLLVSKLHGIQNDIQSIGDYKLATPIDRFVTRLDNVYQVKVSPNTTEHPTLEAEFCRNVALRLPSSSVSKFSAFTNWKTMKEQLQLAYLPKITSFQHLSNCWSFSVGPNTTYSEAATKLTGVIHAARDHIKRKFKEDKGTDMTCDQTFEVVGAMILSELVRGRHPGVYNHLIDVLDNCFTAADVGDKATFYCDRLSDNDKVKAFSAMAPQHQPAQTDKPKSKSKGKKDSSKPKNNQTAEEKARYKELARRCIAKNLCIRFNLDRDCVKSPCPYEHVKLDGMEHDAAAQMALTEWNSVFQ